MCVQAPARSDPRVQDRERAAWLARLAFGDAGTSADPARRAPEPCPGRFEVMP